MPPNDRHSCAAMPCVLGWPLGSGSLQHSIIEDLCLHVGFCTHIICIQALPHLSYITATKKISTCICKVNTGTRQPCKAAAHIPKGPSHRHAYRPSFRHRPAMPPSHQLMRNALTIRRYFGSPLAVPALQCNTHVYQPPRETALSPSPSSCCCSSQRQRSSRSADQPWAHPHWLAEAGQASLPCGAALAAWPRRPRTGAG